MAKTLLLFTAAAALFFTTIMECRAEVPGEAKGLVVYKDPQTSYVEAFEFLNSEQLNAYTSRYTRVGGTTQQAINSGVLFSVTYPERGGRVPTAAQTQADLKNLDSLARQYPQFAPLLNAVSTRLRSSLPPAGVITSLAPPAGPNATPGTLLTFSLKNGTKYLEARIIRVGTDSLTLAHTKGVAEISFKDLPDDLSGLPSQVKDAVLQARKVASQASPTPRGPAPPPEESSSNAVTPASADIVARRNKSVALMRDKLAHDVETTQAEVDRVNKEVGELKIPSPDDPPAPQFLGFTVQRKLDPEKFGSHWPRGSNLYQIQLSASTGGGSAILWTEESQFSSSGRAEMYVKFQNTLSVQLENGFDKETPVFKEVPKIEVEAWNTKQEPVRKLRAELAEVKQKADEATKHQQLFEYSTRKFSSLPLGPVCHTSSRLRTVGFRAQVASSQWNKVLDLIAQADWKGIIKEVLGKEGETATEADVDATFKKLLTTPVTVAIKSDQIHLFIIEGGGGGGYLERPKGHRIVSVASLALPANAEQLLNGRMKDQAGRMRNKVDISTLPSLENLRSDVLPDKNGFVTKWNPSDTDLYFCVDVWFQDTGERSASSELDSLRRTVQTECVDLKRKRDLGELSEADTPKELQRSVNRLFAFANGPLMTDY